ncbi:MULTISPECIES: hypothetical protein [unclassified Aerococcus]|uniref:hypothetical protein n=1 Tax=unclassified Aerococcus TaxID=2618060 RepID=UPI0008A4D88F|nr:MULTISPECIES: hypothetical protein [unclassified Aerococcus]MDK6854915.1 hypothetical protein [Aerococcus sp. UMB7533]OFN02675.1 hypothetical protein HMPREF2626_01825 [Aerococcus sp. HMSC062A02]OHO45490.1 hypothetical protein HMPREF2705_04975 [Aerococcus sp. HMSC035B07]
MAASYFLLSILILRRKHGKVKFSDWLAAFAIGKKIFFVFSKEKWYDYPMKMGSNDYKSEELTR